MKVKNELSLTYNYKRTEIQQITIIFDVKGHQQEETSLTIPD